MTLRFDSPRTLYRFAAVVTAKSASFSLLAALFRPGVEPWVTAVTALLATIGLWRERRWAAGLWLALAIASVVGTFPHTRNHGWLELVAALVVARFALAGRSSRLRTAVRARVVLQLAILSVFFFSGLQKLVHGQFASGEYLLQTILFQTGPLSEHLRALAGMHGPLPRLTDAELALGSIAVDLPRAVVVAARVLGTTIVAAEILLPVCVVLRVAGARWSLLGAQVGIGVVSAELGFALTGTAAIVLLWPRPPAWVWRLAFAVWLVAIWILWLP